MAETAYMLEQAAECERHAANPEIASDLRATYRDIAAKWRRLAAEIEAEAKSEEAEFHKQA